MAKGSFARQGRPSPFSGQPIIWSVSAASSRRSAPTLPKQICARARLGASRLLEDSMSGRLWRSSSLPYLPIPEKAVTTSSIRRPARYARATMAPRVCPKPFLGSAGCQTCRAADFQIGCVPTPPKTDLRPASNSELALSCGIRFSVGASLARTL